jgi:hypothetical protein
LAVIYRILELLAGESGSVVVSRGTKLEHLWVMEIVGFLSGKVDFK